MRLTEETDSQSIAMKYIDDEFQSKVSDEI